MSPGVCDTITEKGVINMLPAQQGWPARETSTVAIYEANDVTVTHQ